MNKTCPKGTYGPNEKEMLLTAYGLRGLEGARDAIKIIEGVEKKLDTVRKQINAIGISVADKPWPEEEIKVLKEVYPIYGVFETQNTFRRKGLTVHNKAVIEKKAERLGLELDESIRGKDKGLIAAELAPKREMRDILSEVKIDDRLQAWIDWMQKFYKDNNNCVVGCESLFKNGAPFKKYEVLDNYGIEWNFFVVLCSLPVQRPRYLHTQKGRDLICSIFYNCETKPSDHFDLIDIESTPYEGRTAKRTSGDNMWKHKLFLKSKSTGVISQVGWENFAQTKEEWLMQQLTRPGRLELKKYLLEGHGKQRYITHNHPTPLNLQKYLDERVTGRCNATGHPIYYHRCFDSVGDASGLEAKLYLASLDKWDCKEGYTLKNTWPVSWGWNWLKGDLAHEDAVRMVRAYSEGLKTK